MYPFFKEINGGTFDKQQKQGGQDGGEKESREKESREEKSC